MKNKHTKLKVLIAAVAVTAVAAGLAFYTLASSVDYTSYDEPYISPSDISISGDNAFVADATLGKVYKASLASGSVTDTWDAGGQMVSGVVTDGDDVYALYGELAGMVAKLDPATMDVVDTAEAGHTPVAGVVVGDNLYVANRFTNNVSVYNKDTLDKVGDDIDVGREPRAMTVVGDKIYVAKHLTEDAATAEEGTTAARVAVIDTTTNTVVDQIQLTNGSNNVKSITSDDEYVYVSHVLGRYAYPTSQLDRGWVNTNAISIIDANTDELVTSVLLDEVELGAPNPWGVAMNGDDLVVSISGAHQIFTIDTNELMDRIDEVAAGENEDVATVADIADYLPFLDGLRNKIDLDGEGNREIAVANGNVYVCQYFTGNVAVVDLENNAVTGAISLGEQPEANAVRTGETLWNDGTKGYQQWESCASCHPEGRSDGFNWDELGDGAGTPKSTKSLVYSHRTPPVLATGAEPTAEDNVRASVQTTSLTESDLTCMDEYLKSLTPVQSPYLNRDGTLTESAERGKELFESQGCATCHPAPLYTDMEFHEESAVYVDGKDAYSWEDRDLDTATLVELWRSAPYYFNGSITSLRDAVVASLPENHGLTDAQIDDLTNFIGSIGYQDEYYGVEQVRSTASDGTEGVNELLAGSTINSITIRKQLETTQQAKVTFTLYDAEGNEISGSSVTETLEDMGVGDVAKISTEIDVPSDLASGSYAVISITDAADDSVKLATDYRIVY